MQRILYMSEHAILSPIDFFEHYVTVNIIRNLLVFNTEYILALILLDGKKLLFMFTGQYNCRCLFRKIKQFHSLKVSFQKRFSLSDQFNVITRNINIYFSLNIFYYIIQIQQGNKSDIQTI